MYPGHRQQRSLTRRKCPRNSLSNTEKKIRYNESQPKDTDTQLICRTTLLIVRRHMAFLVEKYSSQVALPPSFSPLTAKFNGLDTGRRLWEHYLVPRRDDASCFFTSASSKQVTRGTSIKVDQEGGRGVTPAGRACQRVGSIPRPSAAQLECAMSPSCWKSYPRGLTISHLRQQKSELI